MKKTHNQTVNKLHITQAGGPYCDNSGLKSTTAPRANVKRFYFITRLKLLKKISLNKGWKKKEKTVHFKRTILTEGELDADGQESCRKNKEVFVCNCKILISEK